MPNKSLLELASQDWYQLLVSDLEAIKVEFEFNARDLIIRGKHAIGKRLEEDWGKLNENAVQHIGEVTDLGRTDIYNARRFYRKFNDLDKFLNEQPKSVTWLAITKRFLPETPKEEKGKCEGVCSVCDRDCNKSI